MERKQFHVGERIAGRFEAEERAIVMAQWASGENAARWREEVSKALAGK